MFNGGSFFADKRLYIWLIIQYIFAAMFDEIEKLSGCTVSSVPEGYDAFLLSSWLKKAKADILYIVSDGNELARTADLLDFMMPEARVLRFPAWDTVPYDRVSPNVSIVAQRIETLFELVMNPSPKKPRLIVSSIGAVLQKLPPAKIFRNSFKDVAVGKKLDFNEFLHYAAVNGYNRVEQVMEPGEYAVRGDIIDIFPVGTTEPLRLDLFDDEVERIRTFDAMSQRTTGELKSYSFKVMSEALLDANTIKTFRGKYREAFGAAFKDDEIYEAISAGRKYIGMENWLPFFYEDPLPTLFDYLPAAYVVCGKNVDGAATAKAESVADYYRARLEALEVKSTAEADAYRPVSPELLYLRPEQFARILMPRRVVRLTPLSIPDDERVANAGVVPSRDFSFNKSINPGQVYSELKDYLSEYKSCGGLFLLIRKGRGNVCFRL